MTIFINKVPKYTPLYSLTFTEICLLVNIDPTDKITACQMTWKNKSGTKSGKVNCHESLEVIDHMEITIESRK